MRVRFIFCLVKAVYDITFGFKKGEPSILGVMNADPCEIDVLARYGQDRYSIKAIEYNLSLLKLQVSTLYFGIQEI